MIYSADDFDTWDQDMKLISRQARCKDRPCLGYLVYTRRANDRYEHQCDRCGVTYDIKGFHYPCLIAVPAVRSRSEEEYVIVTI